MFSRLNVRTKLLVMLLPAALGLCGLAGLGVQTRLDDRSDARDARDIADVAVAATSFVHRLQLERIAAATAANAPSAALDSMLADHRTATDLAGSALAEVLQRTGRLATGPTAEDIGDVRRGISEVGLIRERPSSEEATEAYTGLIHAELAAVGRLELAVGRAGQDAASRRWLAAAIEAESDAAAQAAVLFDAELDETGRSEAISASQDLLLQSASMFATFEEYATPAATSRLDTARASIGASASEELFEQLAEADPDVPFAADPEAWPALVRARMASIADVEAVSYRQDIVQLDELVADADSAVVYFGAGAAASILALLLLTGGVSRQITTALRRLSDAAREISDEQVPQLVANLRSGTGLVGVRFNAIDTGTTDELAAVGDALNDLARAMEEVAAEQQQSLRKGISDIFVNLARRNQLLLDRQIQFIDRLEANEEDPDQLEHLFHLDHLATRMRRNAESLLVLAGAEGPRRRNREVAIEDVLRVAIGEVEDFARVSLLGVEDSDIGGGVAVDLAHLLAELMENGAQYSPPDRTVDVVGHHLAEGTYVVTITDHGVGMAVDRIDAANRILTSPPPVGLALSRSLGFVVAGTLAQRHGIGVRLSAAGSGGIIAEVVLPVSLLVTRPVAAPAVEPGRAADSTSGVTTGGFGWNASGEYVAEERVDPLAGITFSEERLPEGSAPSKLTEILPEGAAFEQGLYSLLGLDVPAPPPEPAVPEPPAVTWTSAPLPPAALTPEPPSSGLDALPPPSGLPAADAPLPPVVAEPLPPVVPSAPAASVPGLWAPPITHPRVAEPAVDDAVGVAGPAPAPSGASSADAPSSGLPSGPPTTSPPLPRRRPAARSEEPSGEPIAGSTSEHMAAPQRSADDVRSVLSQFRSGRETGRTDTWADPGTPPPYPGPPSPSEALDDAEVDR